MNTRLIGAAGEDFAVKTLEDEGYRILDRNITCAGCEIDVVCECFVDENGNLIKRNKHNLRGFPFFKSNKRKTGEKTIVFCEIKTRYDDRLGTPEESVTPYKIGRYVRAAKAYLALRRLTNFKVRFDVFAIDGDGYKHIVDAFCENDAKYPKH